MSVKTDPVEFIKKLGSEPYPLTEKQKELIKLMEDKSIVRLVLKPYHYDNSEFKRTVKKIYSGE